MSTESFPFVLSTAFSSTFSGGNPAATVFIGDAKPSDETLGVIALNFTQPVVSYISSPLPSTDNNTAAFNIRWFTPVGKEVSLCGHGTIAAAGAIWGEPGMVSEDVDTLEFHAASGAMLKVLRGDGRWYEIHLPAGSVEPVSEAEWAHLAELVSKAMGKEVHVRFIGKGGKGFEYMVLIELEPQDDLEGCVVDSTALRTTGFYINIITTASPKNEDSGTRFVSRMFAPLRIIGGEDHVCGSAHCLLTPYWSRKLGVASSGEIKARQVSPRGGELKVSWNQDKETVGMKGELRVLGRGELFV